MSIDRITPKAIAATHAKISGYVRRTPVLELPGGLEGYAGPVVLKLEQMQVTGTFKARGAFANLLSRDVPEAGIVAASGGNHGAAVAYAAATLGHRAQIFVPEVASPAKLALIKSLGGEVHIAGPTYAEAFAASEELRKSSGAIAVHAYDAPETLLGQGGVGLEFEADAAPLDMVLVAVGGGGLIGGIAAWYQGRVPVIAVEPETSCAYHAARAAGAPIDVSVAGVAIDSLGAKRIGSLPFAIGEDYISDAVLVRDEDIVAAQKYAWTTLRLALEPGGATALAALMSGVVKPPKGARVGIVICGANVDLGKVPQ